MKHLSRFLFLGVFLLFLAGCQTMGGDKEPELQPASPDSNLAEQQAKAPYTIRFTSPQPPAAEHPAQVEREQQVAMVAPAKPSVKTPVVSKPKKLPSGKYRLRSVLVVGDSFAVGIGMSLSSLLQHYDHISLYEKGKTSSGLISKKFYNWEKKLREYLESSHPDALVVMISGNDAHNGSGSKSWASSYETKMADFLSIAAGYDVPVYLVGLPPMGKEDYSERAKVANRAIKNACDKSSDCDYVDAWPLFADETGAFTRHKTIGGASKTLRGKDGVHFTMTGYKLLGSEILDHVGNRFELVKQTPKQQQSKANPPTRKKTASAP